MFYVIKAINGRGLKGDDILPRIVHHSEDQKKAMEAAVLLANTFNDETLGKPNRDGVRVVKGERMHVCVSDGKATYCWAVVEYQPTDGLLSLM